MKKIITFITVEAVQMAATARWDIDIPADVVSGWLPGLIDMILKERKQWAVNKRSYFKDAAFYGYKPEWHEEDDIEEFVGNCINRFLIQKIGRPAYFDSQDIFVPSEYCEKFGRTYLGMI